MRLLTLSLLTCGFLWAGAAHQERVRDAASVLREVMETPDQAIPQELLNRAHCAVIVPGLKRAAFILGARYGKGYVSCRKKSRVGWTAPGTVRIEGGSFGLQIGASETDVVLLVMNERGMDRLLSSQFTLGAGAAVAAGPVGRSTRAATDALLTAEILSWSRSRGVFAGVSLDGATLRQDVGDNRELYGRTLESREIIEKEVPVPKLARELISLLNKYSGRH
ncbi:MAG: lipid-binding SYLF domain-containing protein [Acidobacteria bacterium]|nr:lipid-binding SYLF domain-containing protein [Acidobacteriota bacterium]